MNSSEMKVLLTGASGFIGSHVGATLADAGHQLICLKRRTSNLRRCAAFRDRAVWVDADAAGWKEQIISQRPQAVIHCSWSGVMAAERNDWKLQTQNLDLFSDLLLIAEAVKPIRFIALGSQAEYGPISGRVSEQHPLAPNTAYAAAKLSCLTFLETCARQNQISHAWLRLFSVYGPGEGGQWFIPGLIRQFREGKAPQLTGCEQRYDYLHVRDLAAGILAALRQPEAVGVFNLGSNTSVPLKTVVQLVRQFSGSKAEPLFGALPYRPQQSMHIEGDSSKFNRAFAFAPRISLEEGLRDYVNQPRT